jgi:predicted DNA-binding transcriptional regulator YafY
MSSKLDRIYWLYQQLKTNRYPSRSRYCEQYEVAASSFKRDLEFLRYRLQAPIVYDRLHNGYRLTDDSFELPSYGIFKSDRQLGQVTLKFAPTWPAS